MKPTPSLLVAIAIFSVGSANAGLAIYKSSGTQNVIGNGTTSNVQTKGFLVLDTVTTNATAVGGFKLNGQKYYTIVPLENYRYVQVTGAKGVIYDILAKAESPGTQFAGTVLESAFLIGKDTLVAIDSGGLVHLPRIVTSTAASISHNDSTGVTAAGSGSGTSVLDIKGSMASNNAGEAYDEAVTRLANTFALAGYTKVELPPAN